MWTDVNLVMSLLRKNKKKTFLPVLDKCILQYFGHAAFLKQYKYKSDQLKLQWRHQNNNQERHLW